MGEKRRGHKTKQLRERCKYEQKLSTQKFRKEKERELRFFGSKKTHTSQNQKKKTESASYETSARGYTETNN